jgi:hypothetical protein
MGVTPPVVNGAATYSFLRNPQGLQHRADWEDPVYGKVKDWNWAAFGIRTTAIAVMIISSSGPLVAQNSAEKQAQCELSSIRNTRSSFAVQNIRSACNWLAINGDSLLNARNKGYYLCLVQELSGVQGSQAAAAIISACRRSYPSW